MNSLIRLQVILVLAVLSLVWVTHAVGATDNAGLAAVSLTPTSEHGGHHGDSATATPLPSLAPTATPTLRPTRLAPATATVIPTQAATSDADHEAHHGEASGTPTPGSTGQGGMPHMGMMGSPTAMPYGMMMGQGTPSATGEPENNHDGHGPVASAGVPLATATEGGQLLPYTLIGDTKVFTLTAQVVRWPILQGVYVTAWTYNGTVPGPMLRVTEGDKVRVILQNDLPEATSIHWHGIPVPNAMDGVPPFTQQAIAPGESFTYEFVAQPAGTFMYHSHVNTDRQILLGLYAPFVIDPRSPTGPQPDVDEMLMLSEWTIGPDGETYPAMPMAGMEPNFFTINGKAFPGTKTLTVRQGERVRLRLASIGQFNHPMHLHGAFFKIVATDGNPVPPLAQLTKDTVNVAPGERYDIEFIADNPGTWVLHCHIPHHVTNDSVEPGGLIMVIQVIP